MNSVDLNVGGAPASVALVVDLGADRRVRADQRALVALDADLGVPDRNLERDVPLLPFRRRHRPRAIDRERAHRQQVALAGQHHRGHLLHEVGRLRRHERRPRARRGGRGRHRNLVQVRQRLVHHLAVPAHDLGPALAVGLLNRLLDLLDRFVARQDAGDREEARLHDGVDARAHAGALRQLVGVDGEEADLLLDDLLLHLASAADPRPRPPGTARSAGTPRPAPRIRARRSCRRTRTDGRRRSRRGSPGTRSGSAACSCADARS